MALPWRWLQLCHFVCREVDGYREYGDCRRPLSRRQLVQSLGVDVCRHRGVGFNCATLYVARLMDTESVATVAERYRGDNWSNR
jgi:hypothetical protein